jgi:hypothetical protein
MKYFSNTQIRYINNYFYKHAYNSNYNCRLKIIQELQEKVNEKIKKSIDIQNIKPTQELISDINLHSIPLNNQKEDNLHFSKNLLDILNKALAASSDLSHLPKDFWLNNQNVYQLIESCICDFYAEKYIFIKLKYYDNINRLYLFLKIF